jgi:hypothetical protein
MLGLVLSLPHGARAADLPLASDPSLCLDGMETQPFSDSDYEATPVAVDGGCMVSQDPILI